MGQPRHSDIGACQLSLDCSAVGHRLSTGRAAAEPRSEPRTTYTASPRRIRAGMESRPPSLSHAKSPGPNPLGTLAALPRSSDFQRASDADVPWKSDLQRVAAKQRHERKSKPGTRLLLFAVFVFFLGDYHLGIEAKSHSPALSLINILLCRRIERFRER